MRSLTIRLVILPCLLLTGLGACARFPEIDRAETSRTGPAPVAPVLLPVDQLVTNDSLAPSMAGAFGDALLARAAALRQRADALRGAKTAG